MKRFTLWIVFFAVIGLLVWGMVALVENSTVAQGTLSKPVTAADWTKGATTSKAVLVEYSDFQCPACASYEPLVKTMLATFPNDLTFVYRHFPLITIHRNADYAAGAAEAAGIQGKFWEMHDLLFEKQSEWDNKENALSIFAEYAVSLGLDKEKFESDTISIQTRQKINDAYRSGTQSGVKGTPTFFLNGKMIQSPRSEEEFKQIIQNAIASSTVSQ